MVFHDIVLPAMGWMLASFLIAWLAVRFSISYALARGMLDLPGQRRSHLIATPRGGGIGLVLAVMICWPGALLAFSPEQPHLLIAAVSLGLLAVALIGWWDDRHTLSVLPRLLVQILATALVGAAMVASGVNWAWFVVLIPAGLWSINLHNFMDGIDGLLAQQGMFVFAGLGIVALFVDQGSLATGAGVIALACLGFWVFNRAPARIFMGDVGSASLGFLVFANVVMLWRVDSYLLWPAALLCSAFVTDASLTLVSRMLAGRRWYSPHREHLYQWLVRRGFTHRQVARRYTGFNMLAAAPMALLATLYPRIGWVLCILGYSMTCLTWRVFKRRCLRRERFED